MSPTNSRSLYDLLPAVHRDRDARAGGALRELLGVMDEELRGVEDDIWQWYENWFVETCEPWITSYLGELVDAVAIHPVAADGGRPRTHIANTIRNRRRKGTLAGLEQSLSDVSGWPVHAVEMFRRVVEATNVRHAHPNRDVTPSLRDGARLDRVRSTFDDLPRALDVRSIARARGRYGLANVALFAHASEASPIQMQRAAAVPDYELGEREDGTSGFFRFDLLGRDRPLVNPRRPLPVGTVAPSEHALPVAIRRRALFEDLARYRAQLPSPSGHSAVPPAFLPSARPAFEVRIEGESAPVSPERFVVADLSRWHRPSLGTDMIHWPVAIDPELGRIALPVERSSARVVVSYHVSRRGRIGGGYDPRNALEPATTEHAPLEEAARARGFEAPVASVVTVHGGGSALADAIENALTDGDSSVAFEIDDSEVYTLGAFTVPADAHFVVRAGNHDNARAALIRVPAQWDVTLGAKARLAFAGVVVDGGTLDFAAGEDAALSLTDCTFAPVSDPESERFGQPSITVVNEMVASTFLVKRCVTGPLLVLGRKTSLFVEDSILDAGHDDAFGAFCARGSFSRVTVLGRIAATTLELASNSIFSGGLVACRPQRGCVRFCYFGEPSLAPSAHRCQPVHALAAVTGDEADAVRARLVPVFVSRMHGTAGYAQLASTCADEIRRGADNESEMGAFNLLFAPQREDNLRTALTEQLRFGLEAGFVFVP